MRLTADFKENNLDLLRLLFAVIVVLFHTSALTGITGLAVLGEYCNPHFAVRGFFVISGLLIYRSYTRSTSIRSYLEKRVRRIYPAYFVVVVGAAAFLPLLTLGFPAYIYGGAFWKYLGANLLFLNFLAPNLPGVFTTNA
ncbi:MAG: acyltransferase family protein, partial [Terracidiphilus sp.]